MNPDESGNRKHGRTGYLIDKRARALTTMLLTRREDLLVEGVKDDIGLDFIVRLHTKGKDGLRAFAPYPGLRT